MKTPNYKNRMWQAAFYLIFLIYALLALKIILFKTISLGAVFTERPFGLRSINLVPFRTIAGFFTAPMDLERALVNVLGNIAIFVPLGIFVSYVAVNRSLGFKATIILISTLMLEIVQYVFALGSSDIDDILLNFAGGLIGIVIYMGGSKVFRSRERLLIAIVGFCLLAGIGGVIVIWEVDRDLLPFFNSRTVFIDENRQLMAGLNEGMPDIFGDFVSIQNDTLTVRENSKFTVVTSSPAQEISNQNSVISLNASTKIIYRHIRSEGNKVITRYEQGALSGLAAIINSTNEVPTVRVWLAGEDNLAAALLVSFLD